MAKSKGTIKFFNSQKGFGFIAPDNGGKDLFVHANNVQGDPKSLREGQKVEFVEGVGRKGPEAIEVSPL
jgi:CspA family cold shock protein